MLNACPKNMFEKVITNKQDFISFIKICIMNMDIEYYSLTIRTLNRNRTAFKTLKKDQSSKSI